MTYQDFLLSYYEILTKTSQYRVGQHFCNLFIKDSSTHEMCKLWEERDFTKACVMIKNVIDMYSWDYDNLPLLNKEYSC